MQLNQSGLEQNCSDAKATSELEHICGAAKANDRLFAYDHLNCYSDLFNLRNLSIVYH